MPWGRLDDGLYDHPKLDQLGRDRLPAVGLWTLAISWCNRRLTDGFIPTDRVRLLGGSHHLAEKLVVAGLFEHAPDGYQVHDFLEFNDSKATIEARRAADVERKRKVRGGHPSTPDSAPPSDGSPPARPRGVRTESARTSGGTHARPHDRPRPDPTHTESRPRATTVEATTARAPEPRATLLTKEQLTAWATFGPEWDQVKAAWLKRGFHHPPAGDATDDDTSQRGLLYAILDARPTDLVRWITDAPGRTAADVVGHVLRQWREVRAEAASDDNVPWLDSRPSRTEAAETVGTILGRMARPGQGAA